MPRRTPLESLEPRTLFATHIAPNLFGDWPTLGGPSGRSGYFSGTLGTAVAIPGWTRSTTLNALNAIATGEGKAYINNTSNGTALDPATGTVLFTFDTYVGSSITYANGRIYSSQGALNGALKAFDANTGAPIWSVVNPSMNTSSPVAVTDSAIWIPNVPTFSIAGSKGFDLNGNPIATASVPNADLFDGSGYLSPYGDSIYAYARGTVSRFNALTGAVAWSVGLGQFSNLSDTFYSYPAIANGQVFVTSGSGLTAINSSDGSVAWTIPGQVSGSPAFGPSSSGGEVFANFGSTVQARSATDGQLLQTYVAPSNLVTQPIITDDAVIASSDSNTFIFDRNSGQLTHTLNGGGLLSISDNRLFITHLSPSSIDATIYEYGIYADIEAVLPTNLSTPEGLPLTLTADSQGAPAASYEWDFNYDGATFTPDATGQSPTFTAPNGPATRTIALRVTTADGVTNIATSSLTITNTPPTASATFATRTFTVTASDVPEDTLTYSFDFDNDGTFDLTNQSSPAATLPAQYILSGPASRTARIEVTDSDGASTDVTVDYDTSTISRSATATGPSTTEATLPYTLTLDASLTTLSGWKINWGDHISSTLPANATTATHTYAKDGLYSITAVATGSPETQPAPIPVTVTSIPDLAVSLPALPATAIPGKPTKTPVTLTNLGTGPASAKTTLVLHTSATSTPSADDPVVGSMTASVKLKPGQSKTFSVKTLFPDSLDQTSAYVYAEVVTPKDFTQRTTANDTTALSTSTTFNKYFTDLTLTAKVAGHPPTQPFHPGSSIKLSASLLNLGTIASSGETDLNATLYQGDPNDPANSIEIDQQSTELDHLILHPNGKHPATLTFLLPPSALAGSYFIKLTLYTSDANDLSSANDTFTTPAFQVTR